VLEKIDLSKKLSKKQFEAEMPALERRLYDLEKACWDAGIPSVIVFEGWDAAGKGSTVNHLTQHLEPRGFRLHPIRGPRTMEQHLPWLWRFWVKLPNYGQMAIFDRSWYGRVLVERVEKLVAPKLWKRAYQDIVYFELTIADDGYVIMKFFLHISKKEQGRRFRRLERDPLESWHVQKEDWKHHKHYEEYLEAIEAMLERTQTEWGPWTVVEATDRCWTRHKVFSTIVARLERTLVERGKPLPQAQPEAKPGRRRHA